MEITETNAKRPPLSKSCQRCVDFEAPLALGTRYGGSAGNKEADVIFTTNNIIVSVHKFFHSNGTSTFGDATIANPPHQFGINQTINTNNINLNFNFTGIGFIPNEVQFEFLNQGGHQNLAVNGQPLPPFMDRLEAAPSSIAGVSIAVFTARIPGGVMGLVILRGQVKSLVVGGQEFWLDQVCAR